MAHLLTLAGRVKVDLEQVVQHDKKYENILYGTHRNCYAMGIGTLRLPSCSDNLVTKAAQLESQDGA